METSERSAVGVPFCDYLGLTFPRAEVGDAAPPIVETILLLLAELGCQLTSEGVYELGAYSGKVYSKRRGAVWMFSISGAAMRSIREAGLLKEMVMLIHDVPHRVTRLDASCDYATDAPQFLAGLHRRLRKGSIVMGKKVVRDSDMTAYICKNERGYRTGTIYLGSPKAEVRGCIYDKQFERVSKGFSDPGEMLRIEIRLRSQVGCSVFDAVSPERLYYHYAAPDLCELPESVRPWEANGQGFEVQHNEAQFTPYARLKSLIGESAVIDQMFRLARMDGAGGLQSVFGLLQRRFDTEGQAKSVKLSLVA
jgi:Replication initiation factor.